MPYWIDGRDRETGESTRIFSNESSESAARAEAARQGMEVEAVEYVSQEAIDQTRDQAMEEARPRPLPPWGFTTFCLDMGRLIAFVMCLVGVGGAAFALIESQSSAANKFVGLLAGAAVFFLNAALFIVIDYVRSEIAARDREAMNADRRRVDSGVEV